MPGLRPHPDIPIPIDVGFNKGIGYEVVTEITENEAGDVEDRRTISTLDFLQDH
jgi:hypothetical protein